MSVEDLEPPTGETRGPPQVDEFSSANRAPAESAPPDPVGSLISAPPPGMADIQQRKGEATSRVLDATERRTEEDRTYMKQRFDAMGVETEKMRPWDHDKERQKYETNPIEAFGSFGSLFGLVASAFTRAPMENALNASAAAMSAVRENNDKEYEKAHTSWKENMELVKKRHDMMQTQFNDAATLMRTDLTLGEAKAKNIATRFGDEQSLLLLNAGMSKEWFELIDGRNKALEGAERAATAIDRRRMSDYFFDTMMDKAKETGADKDPSTVLRIWQKAHGISPGSVEEELTFRYMSTKKADGTWPTPEETGKFYHNLKQRASVDAISTDRVNAEEIRRRQKQYVEDDGMNPAEAFDRATREVNDAKTPISKLTPAQQFTKRFFEEKPEATSEEYTTALGEFVKSQKREPNLTADQTWIKQFYKEKPEAGIEEFTKAFDEFKKGQKSSTGAAGGNTDLTMARQNAATAATLREKLKKTEDPETGELYTPEKAAELAANRYRQLQAASTPITATNRDHLRSMITRADLFEQTIDKIENLLLKHNAITGLGGKLTRPVEAIGNAIGASNETDRKEFERLVSHLGEWGPRLLNELRGRPLAAEASQMSNIIAGKSIQDTGLNTLRAYKEMRPIIRRIREDLEARERGEWTPPPKGGTGGGGGGTDGKWWERDKPAGSTGKRSSNQSDTEEISREMIDVPPGENLADYIPSRRAG